MAIRTLELADSHYEGDKLTARWAEAGNPKAARRPNFLLRIEEEGREPAHILLNPESAAQLRDLLDAFIAHYPQL